MPVYHETRLIFLTLRNSGEFNVTYLWRKAVQHNYQITGQILFISKLALNIKNNFY